MTPEKQRIAIAEWMGWEHPDVVADYWDTWHHRDSPLCPDGKCIDTDELPDYCNDLDAIHEAEKKLTEEQHRKFRVFLKTVCADYGNCHSDKARQDYVSSTAHQRREALLRTIGRWEEA